ncbi:MAG: GDP-L-fucose synthase [Alphaproteobacteria bacterium]|nr:GDP-L-fucose synthase [Alphaproteobacteria bacterium]
MTIQPLPYSLKAKRVWVAGHTGMVGGAIVRRLGTEGCEILTAPRSELDLADRARVDDWLEAQRPDAVFLAAARVGGIAVNDSRPVDFLHDNLAIELSAIGATHERGVEKLMFLGSACIYPKDADQPMAEDALLTGPLEQTNEFYAVAKIAGIKLCQAYRRQYGCDYISVMPNNLYGPGDNFHPEHSHVPAALLRRFHEAKQADAPKVTVWGSGRPLREFLHVDDLADACVFLMQTYTGEGHVNIGSGTEIRIRDFAKLIGDVTGYDGELVFDASRPDGVARKLLDTSRLNEMGWQPKINLEDGLRAYYAWFLENEAALRAV